MRIDINGKKPGGVFSLAPVTPSASVRSLRVREEDAQLVWSHEKLGRLRQLHPRHPPATSLPPDILLITRNVGERDGGREQESREGSQTGSLSKIFFFELKSVEQVRSLLNQQSLSVRVSRTPEQKKRRQLLQRCTFFFAGALTLIYNCSPFNGKRTDRD